MSLNYANRRRAQTSSKACSGQKQASVVGLPTEVRQQQLPIRKQCSFIDKTTTSTIASNSKFTAAQCNYLRRGLSVERSIESLRQKLYTPKDEKLARLIRPSSLDGKKNSKQTQNGFHVHKNSDLDKVVDAKMNSNKNLVAWASTTSLHKNSDGKNSELLRSSNNTSTEVLINKQNDNSAEVTTKPDNSNRINLNIVLAQTIRATTELEIVHSDNESTVADCLDVDSKDKIGKNANNLNERNNSAGQRRAQYQQSRVITAAATDIAASANSNHISQLNISAALTVQRRPPLVRAMSAPVRSLDENSKSVLATNKRQQKLRRRKILTRNITCDKSNGSDNDVLNTANADIGANNKKLLTRSCTVNAPDVITLVSLLSSEGSDSEKEDDSGNCVNNVQSPNKRTPFLRKTGKSVSFQDGYSSTFQLASKEYSHMIRRSSIAPLAARMRSNRPPTAPPVSIFLSGSQKTDVVSSGNSDNMADDTKPDAPHSEKENNAANCNVHAAAPEYVYPEYVCSIKERECWKLYKKMSSKGINVSYETISRGMLTPTEFRQLQKQREIAEAKLKEAEEAAAEANVKPKVSATAIERLSESLLSNNKKAESKN